MAVSEYFVIELTKTFKGANRNLMIENWFSSNLFAQKLLKEHQLTTVGTLKKGEFI